MVSNIGRLNLLLILAAFFLLLPGYFEEIIMKTLLPGRLLVFFALVTLSFAIASCGKDEDVSGIPKTTLLTGSKWYIKALDVDPAYPVVIGGLTFKVHDLYFLFDNCVTDNYLIFNNDSTLVSDAGPSRCSADEEQTYYGTWQLDSTESNISWTIPAENIVKEYGIAGLDRETLKLIDVFEENGVTYRGILTLKH